jgi:transposase InsO family protein
VEIRKETGGRCAEVVHRMLQREGKKVSLSSVKRTLDRKGLTKSTRKKYYRSGIRPKADYAGDLVQVDTIHLMETPQKRIYIYTLLDVHSRWAYAEASEKISAVRSVRFVKNAQSRAPFIFRHLQSDHGSEFSRKFTERVRVSHRHSRVRQPNDNAHLERFNRTIQTELIRKLPTEFRQIRRKLPNYLRYYNEERLHLGLDLMTPMESVKCCKAID